MRITKRIREMVKSERAIAYWEALPEDQRRDYFENARVETLIAIGVEAELGVHDRRTYYGRGAVTAQAVDDAYLDSTEFEQLRDRLAKERKDEFDSREFDCVVCGRETIAKRSMLAGDQAQCYDCCPPKWQRLIDKAQ